MKTITTLKFSRKDLDIRIKYREALIDFNGARSETEKDAARQRMIEAAMELAERLDNALDGYV